MKFCVCATLLGLGQLGHFWGHILKFRKKKNKQVKHVGNLVSVLHTEECQDFSKKEEGKEGPTILF